MDYNLNVNFEQMIIIKTFITKMVIQNLSVLKNINLKIVER